MSGEKETKHQGEIEGVNDEVEGAGEDEDIEAMKRKVAEIEAEYERLQNSDKGNDEESAPGVAANGNAEAQGGKPATEAEEAKDDNSVFIGNLDESVTPDVLQEFFKSCGTINRITIMCDKFTGKPKGFAYMEFDEHEAVELALGLHETEMNGRPIKVTPKRKNVPRFMMRGRGRGRYRGHRGRGGYRGYRGRGRGYRGRARGRGRYAPY